MNTSGKKQFNYNKNKFKFLKYGVIGSTIILLSLLVFFFQFDLINKFLIKDKLEKSIIKIQQSFTQVNLGINRTNMKVKQFLENYPDNLYTQKQIIFQLIFMRTQTTKNSKSLYLKYQKQLQSFFLFLSQFYKQDLKVLFKQGHIGQLDQNILQKLQYFVNKGQFDYLSQIFANIQNINFGYECQFTNKECIQTKIFVFESSFMNKKQIDSYHKYKNSYLLVLKVDNLQSESFSKYQSNHVYSQQREDKEQKLNKMYNQPNKNNAQFQLQSKQIMHNVYALQEIVLDQLQLSSLFQLCSEQQQQQCLDDLKQQMVYINDYQQLLALSQLLQYLNNTVSFGKNLTLENIFSSIADIFVYQLKDQQYQLLDSKLNQIITMNLTKYQSELLQNNIQGRPKLQSIQVLLQEFKILVANIRQNNLSYFPSDYKLGIFLPIIAVILYPTAYYLKTVLMGKLFN